MAKTVVKKDETGTNTSDKSTVEKLDLYLLLLYQRYLKGETLLDPKIQMAIWRRVKLGKDFPDKIRLAQLQCLGFTSDQFDVPWNVAKEKLFPAMDIETAPLSKDAEKLIQEYKEETLRLLQY